MAVAPTILKNGTRSRLRIATVRYAPRMNSGHSLNAVPKPTSTPASHHLRLRAASIAATAKKIEGMSQLVNAWTISSGEPAMSSVSQMRLPASSATMRMVITQMMDISSAVT